MEPFTEVSSVAAPLDRPNVDTDQIIPKQFLKRVEKTGFGRCLFYNWRYDARGEPVPGFVLNEGRYESSRILIAGENFGCGSSREHAVWALMDYGFRVVIAPSFADIFYSNCFKNGLLPVRMRAGDIDSIRAGTVRVDLESQTVESGAVSVRFEIEGSGKEALLEGLDEISRTMKLDDMISGYEGRSRTPPLL